MNKVRKGLLVLGTVGTIVAPLAAVVSCGGTSGYQGRYEMPNDSQLTLMHAFSSTGEQAGALEMVTDIWNKDTVKHKHINLAHVEGGYKAIGPQLAQSFEAGDTRKVPNMIVDYPDTLGTLTKYDMTIPVIAKNDTATRDIFSPEFMKINNEIGGLAKDSGTFAMPIAKSIDMATFNTPVFKRIWDAAVVAKIAKGTVPDTWKNLGDASVAPITTLWADSAKKSDITALHDDKKFTFDQISTNAAKMLDFVTKARPLFVENKETYILGIDSTVNFIYQAVYQEASADEKKFLFSKGTDGYIKYNWGAGDAKKIFQKVYKKLKAAIDAKGVYLNTGGAYSSSLETQHKIAVAYGSTAGYKHNYIGSDPVPFYTTSTDKIKFTSYTNELKQTTSTTSTGLLGTFGKDKYANNLVLSTGTFTSTGEYVTKLANVGLDEKVKTFLNSHKSNVYVSTSPLVSNVEANDKLQISTGKYSKYLVAMSGVSDAKETLGKDEIAIMKTPAQFRANGAKATLVQGPSLIGIHANATEDKDVLEFSKWFMSENLPVVATNVPAVGTHGQPDYKASYDTYTIHGIDVTNYIKGRTNKATIKPYELFAAKSGYVVPTRAAFKAASLTSGNDAQKLTFDTLKAISADNNYHAFDNAVDDTTGTFRKKLESTMGTVYTAAKANRPTLTADQLYTSMNR